MKTQYDLGLSKIYELVINSNPCYAFLLDSNTLIQNKLIIAHVLAHCDFFKNNFRFASTNRDMIESMSASAERIRRYEYEYGIETVENFLDAALSIHEHIDPGLFPSRRVNERPAPKKASAKKSSAYDDLWTLDEAAAGKKTKEEPERKKRFPEEPEKDLLWFIEQYSADLEDWQRDILTMLRDEMLYFWPQIETKIMNEGWASYWHIRILRELDLTPAETVEFSRLNASVVQPSRHTLNPYYLGLKMFEDIENRWGREKLFEVRELDTDISFLRNYLTKELVNDLDLYIFEKQGSEWKITDKDWENVRDQLVYSRVNGGFPYIVVEDGNFKNRGELYLKHYYEGVELDIKYVEKTLPYVYQLWGKPVHLETVVENKNVIFTNNGNDTLRKFV
jgi:stage V sporulation protein R